MSDAKQSPEMSENRLLAALPVKERERLRPHLKEVPLPFKETVYQPDEPIRHLFFPLSGLCSIISTTDDGGSVEVGIVGREGLIGVSVLLGSDKPPNEIIVQGEGRALRMAADVLKEEFRRGGSLQRLLLRYVEASMVQFSQIGACNNLHPVNERLARWLLMAHDRVGQDELPLTQEFIAMMLGVRRAGVTEAAGALQEAGIIGYARGHIHILNRKKLEAASCECYRIIKNESERILGRGAL
jgi:CRP-like cAMP-binding protein